MMLWGGGTSSFFIKTVTLSLYEGSGCFLPGVFVDINRERCVNGSLWSLMLEARCYLLFIFACALGFRTRLSLGCVAFFSMLLSAWNLDFLPLASIGVSGASVFFFSFWLGVFFCCIGELCPRGWKIVILMFFCILFINKNILYSPYFFCLGLGVLIYTVAFFHPIGFPKKWGDLSYGIFLYGWPVQQVCAHYLRLHEFWQQFLAPLILVLPIAFLSWHIFEKPALRLKMKLFKYI
jgi:peptidoglycan/LPS O-acetylase OafA/YrhL